MKLTLLVAIIAAMLITLFQIESLCCEKVTVNYTETLLNRFKPAKRLK